MELTEGVITRAEAIEISPTYVRFSEGDFNAYNDVATAFAKLRRGQAALTYTDGQFVKVKVSSINHNDVRAIDGPIVRVSNGEFSWRVDGCGYAWPL